MENKKAPSHEDIKKKWEAMSSVYTELIAENFRELVLTLANKIDAEKGEMIVETGCGDGNLSVELALSKSEEAKLVCIDIATNMCQLTSNKLEVLESILNSGGKSLLNWRQKILAEYKNGDFEQFNKERHFALLNTSVCEGNNESITSLVGEGVADKYIANLSLHIVQNPDVML